MKFVLAALVVSFSVSSFASVDARDCKLTVKMDGRKGSSIKVAKSKIVKNEQGEVVLFNAIKGIGGQVILLNDGAVRGAITTSDLDQGILAELDSKNPTLQLRQMKSDMTVVDVTMSCVK